MPGGLMNNLDTRGTRPSDASVAIVAVLLIVGVLADLLDLGWTSVLGHDTGRGPSCEHTASQRYLASLRDVCVPPLKSGPIRIGRP